MNSLFGRSKSKHRNAKGNLKDRIGNPTPIDPININGAFIDLKLTPQDGSAGPAVGLNAGVPPVPQPPIASQHNLEDEGRNEDSSIRSDQRRNQPQPPNRPRHDDSDTQNNHYQVQEYLRGNSGRTVREASDDDVSNGSRGRTTGRNQNQPHTRPFSPLQSADSGRKNISHPAASEDDEVGHSASASLSSVSTSKYRGRALEQTLRTDAGSPVVYTPYSSASPYTSRGRQPEHPARISPDQQQERGRTIGRTTPTEKRSSSNYSSATSIEEPLTYSESHRQFEHRHRPERIDIAPARALQQAETAKYFDADATLEDPVSPLLPSPRRHNRDRELQSSPEISPEFGPTPIHSSPGHLDLDLNKEDASAALDISFSDFSMPAPAMGARDHLRSPEISAPRSPEVNRLPAYLGKMQPVQRQLDYGEPTSPPSQRGDPITSPKRSLSRKVSTKLRTLVGSGGKPREPLPESGIVTTTSISTTSVRNVKGGLNKDAISGPIPIPAKDQQPDPEIEAIMARFDKERGPRPARMAEQIQDKVDVWNYNPSAASSASNISLHPSYKSADDVTITESEASHGNPGLSSHRSSTRSSNRNLTPETPVTPADDGYSFSALRGPANFGDSMKSDTTVKQKDYLPPVGRSEEVPFFLDTTSEIKAAVPSFTHEPPTPEPHKTTFSRVFLPEHSSLGRIDDRNEDGAFSDVSTNTEFTRPSPTISTAPTSVVSSPRTPFSPMSVVSPTARRPPFGPGGPKMMLRSATMSSRPNGGTPLQPKPKPEPIVRPIVEEEAPMFPSRQTSKASTLEAALSRQTSKGSTLDSRQPSRAHTPDSERNLRSGDHTPTSPYSRSGSAFSFVREDVSVIRPSDSASQYDPRHQRSLPGSPRSGSRSGSPTPFDVDRSLPRQPSLRPAKSHAVIRPKTASRIQNDRVSALSKLDTDLPPRPSTSNMGHASLRLNTDIRPNLASSSFSAIDAPKSSASQTLKLPENNAVKRSKSVGEGLRRAFSRRAPMPPAPSPALASDSVPPVPEDGAESGPSSPAQVSGPLGFGKSSDASKARWNTALRAAAVSAALQQRARSDSGSQPSAPGIPEGISRSAANPNRASVVLKAQPLTAEERGRMHHAPGTLFIRICEEGEDGIGACNEHRMKPRKGGTMQKCGFCLKGPFANMWVCLDGEDGAPEAQGDKVGLGGAREREEKREEKCSFAVCRMCCNEKVQEGTAEIF